MKHQSYDSYSFEPKWRPQLFIHFEFESGKWREKYFLTGQEKNGSNVRDRILKTLFQWRAWVFKRNSLKWRDWKLGILNLNLIILVKLSRSYDSSKLLLTNRKMTHDCVTFSALLGCHNSNNQKLTNGHVVWSWTIILVIWRFKWNLSVCSYLWHIKMALISAAANQIKAFQGKFTLLSPVL